MMSMRFQRFFILLALAGLTSLFLGAAYTVWLYDVPNLIETFRRAEIAPTIYPTAGPVTANPRALRLTIPQTGLVAVSAVQLEAAGFQPDAISAEKLRLTHNGRSVPFHVAESEGEPALFFYGQAGASMLEPAAVYQLSRGQGQRMPQRDAQPNGQGETTVTRAFHWEENSAFVPHATGGDLWMGPLLFAPGSWSYTFDAIRPTNGPAELTLQLFSNTAGPTKPDHHVELLLNGAELGEWFWDGIKAETITFSIAEGLLRADNSNTLTVRAPGDMSSAGESIYINWLKLTYQASLDEATEQVAFSSAAANVAIAAADGAPLIFDVTEPNAPVVLANLQVEGEMLHFANGHGPRRYVALPEGQAITPQIQALPTWETALRDGARGADYVAIVANVAGFEAALEPLLTYRREQGLRATAVPVEQIYDEFGHGHRGPQAIRDFLAYAAANWAPPAPRFVLLVGDATHDVQDRALGKNRNLLPTGLAHSRYAGYLPSDAWYTQGAGASAANAAIGRFPVQTLSQLETLVNKTLTYEQSAGNQPAWRQRALLVAGNEPRFERVSDDLGKLLDGHGYEIYALHMNQGSNIHFDLMSALNKGVGLLSYVGHGNEQMWDAEAILQNQHAALLKNGARLPILTTFTCPNGAFTSPQSDSLAESLLWTREGGVVAAVAPAGRGAIEDQLPLVDLFYTILLSGETRTLGEALLALQQAPTADADLREFVAALNLLGDPALRFQAP
jgi:hypothetical protein